MYAVCMLHEKVIHISKRKYIQNTYIQTYICTYVYKHKFYLDDVSLMLPPLKSHTTFLFLPKNSSVRFFQRCDDGRVNSGSKK